MNPQPKFEFKGIKCTGSYQWAIIKMTLDADESLGKTEVTISVTLSSLYDKNHLQLKQELLSLAPQVLNIQPLIDWAKQQASISVQ